MPRLNVQTALFRVYKDSTSAQEHVQLVLPAHLARSILQTVPPQTLHAQQDSIRSPAK